MTSIVQNYPAYDYKPTEKKAIPQSVKVQNDHELMQKTSTEKEPKMLCAKVVKPKEAKKLVTVMREWFSRYSQRPHRHDINDIKDNATTVISFIEDYQKQSSDKNSSASLNRLS